MGVRRGRVALVVGRGAGPVLSGLVASSGASGVLTRVVPFFFAAGVARARRFFGGSAVGSGPLTSTA
ncbi:hypothetical protein AB0O07_30105 [Streptomyces sp. NPDC093085]|uniref:hypothetical protein n=1 Tax=Streptomyces sp. NPDC093085 TaxID=3155068 RepID=UPI00343C80AC